MAELDELHEQAEHAHEDSSLVPVSFTMALLAVLVALATLLGHRAHTEELLMQTKASDKWAEYQAKSIRQSNSEMLQTLLAVGQVSDVAKAHGAAGAAEAHAKKYEEDKKDLGDQARDLEKEVAGAARRGDRLDLSEALLETGLVITSIALITRRRGFWYAGMLAGAVGVVFAGTALR